jgi:hypothetical protein
MQAVSGPAWGTRLATAEVHPVTTSVPKSTRPTLDQKALPTIRCLRPTRSALLIAPTGATPHSLLLCHAPLDHGAEGNL